MCHLFTEISITHLHKPEIQYKGTKHDPLYDTIYTVSGHNFNICYDNVFVILLLILFNTDHRHTFHHTHHPLSTHLPLPQRLRKRVHSTDRRRKKKRKKKKTSLPPSDVTPTIQEVDEEEAESETDGQGVAATPTEPPDIQPQVK